MTSIGKKPVTTDPSYTSLGGHWCTIESTPTVFNALVMKNGIRDTHVKEVWSLEPEIFNMLKNDHVYGFIFLLRPQEGRMSKYEELLEPMDTSKIYFANQVIPDACGTQALLSIAMNSPDMEIGPVLNEFKEFTAKFEPKDKGLAMTNCRQLRENHNSLSDYYERDPILPLPFLVEVDDEDAKEGEEEDQFHYVAYVYIDGYVWELDGLQSGPLRRMACTRETWLDAARIELKARMMTYEEGEDHFVLMAVVKDPLVTLKAGLDRLRNEEVNDNNTNDENGGGDQNNNNNNYNYNTGNNQTQEEIKEVEREITNLVQEREAEKKEIREMEADFRESINIFMKALVQLEQEDEMKNKSKKRKRK